QAEDGIRGRTVTGVQTCALPIYVYPAEVESVLHEHPAVADAAVVAVPDERWGEVGVAFVVAAAGVSEEEIVEFVRGRLARFKAQIGRASCRERAVGRGGG